MWVLVSYLLLGAVVVALVVRSDFWTAEVDGEGEVFEGGAAIGLLIVWPLVVALWLVKLVGKLVRRARR
jgi:hypothetical protein